MLSGPEVVRPLPVRSSSALGLWALHYLWWRDLALVYLGGLLHALGWLGPSLWRSSSDLGPRALHYHLVARSYADGLPGGRDSPCLTRR